MRARRRPRRLRCVPRYRRASGSAAGARRTADRGAGREPRTGSTRAVYQGWIEGRKGNPGSGRDSTSSQRYKRALIRLGRNADLPRGEKTSWNMPRNRLASTQRNRPVKVASPRSRSSGSVWRRRKRSVTRSRLPEDGKRNRQIRVLTLHRLGASKSCLEDARNERLAVSRQDRGEGVAAAIATKIAND